MFDISLDLRRAAESQLALVCRTHGVHVVCCAAPEAKAKPHMTLMDCLRRFTAQEQLAHGDKFLCPKCGSHQESTKQFSLESLPLVMCLHLKVCAPAPSLSIVSCLLPTLCVLQRFERNRDKKGKQ